MKKNRPLNEIKKLNKVVEVSLCTSYNPPANGFKSFEIIKNSIKKDAYEDLFEELKMPEYGDFLSYLDCWLEDDVNRVAYAAFLDALFGSLQDITWDESLDKAGKSAKFKETFDSFIKEYENSVITKSEDGKVKLNINKSKDVDIRKYYGECIAEQCGDSRTFSDVIAECAPDRINNSLWDMFTWKLNDKIFDIHYLDESKYSKEDKAKMLSELFTEFVDNFNITELIKSNKQEKKVKDNILTKLQKFVADLAKTEEEPVTEEVVETETEQTENQETEVAETPAETEVQEPEQTETPAEEVTPESEEPTQEPTGEEAPAESETEEQSEAQEEVEEAQEPEQTEEVAEETPAVEKTTETETEDEIVKAQSKITELEQQVLDLQKSQQETEVKLEKAEILKEVSKDYVGLPQTKDEVVEALYELNKASLSEVSKKFILESLKSLSDLNKESFQELGHSEEVDVNKSAEEVIADKVKKTMQEHDILEEQALLVVTEGRSIAKAKEVTEIVRKRKN